MASQLTLTLLRKVHVFLDHPKPARKIQSELDLVGLQSQCADSILQSGKGSFFLRYQVIYCTRISTINPRTHTLSFLPQRMYVMLDSVLFFLGFLTIIEEKELGECVREYHMGVFLFLCVDCLKDSKPQTCQLSPGQPCNGHQQREK